MPAQKAHANDPPTLRMVLTDISDQVLREAQVKHLNRVLRTISACNEDLVRARSEADLLGDICRDIVEIGSYLLAWVAEADPTFPGASTPIAWAGDETSYLVHARLDHDPDHLRYCLVSAALGSQRSQVCNRLNATPECAFGELSELGAQSVLSLPLQNDGRLYGALTIFSTQSDAF
ncbi:MAG: GAF domain-containing protein [Gallionellaceae bacterium]|nr:GAF domain-containing protein [Gallionellaceae bacterium]